MSRYNLVTAGRLAVLFQNRSSVIGLKERQSWLGSPVEE